MDLILSKHWLKKREKKRKDISKDTIEFAITNSKEMKDKYWEGVFNVVCKVPPSGRMLKVVYKKADQKVFIVTAYWLN